MALLAAAGVVAGCSSDPDMAASTRWSSTRVDQADVGADSAVSALVDTSAAHGATIVSASSPVAESVTVVGTDTNGSNTDTITVPTGDQTVLALGGSGLTLARVRQPLLVGQTIPLTIVYADGSTAHLDVAVSDSQEKPLPRRVTGEQ